MQNPVLSIQGVSKFYKLYDRELDRVREIITGKPRFRKIEALKPISLDVGKGEVLGVIGQNGAGKSTLLKVLARTLQPSSGKMIINGRIAALLELGASFHPDMTGHENIYLSCAIQGLDSKEIDAIYDEIVAFADIGEFIHRPVKTYSSGMLSGSLFPSPHRSIRTSSLLTRHCRWVTALSPVNHSIGSWTSRMPARPSCSVHILCIR